MYRKYTTMFSFNNWPIAIKFIIIFSAVISIIYSTVGLISYRSYKQSMEEQIKENVSQLLGQINMHLDTLQNELISMAQNEILPSDKTEIFQALNHVNTTISDDPFVQLKQSMELYNSLDFLNVNEGTYVSDLVLFTKNHGAFIRTRDGGFWRQDISFKEEAWFPTIDSTQLSPLMYGIDNQRNLAGSPFVFKVIQPVINLSTSELMGYLEADGAVETFSNMLRNVNFGTGSTIYILDHKNKLMYSTQSENIGQTWKQDFHLNWNDIRSTGSTVETIDGITELISFNRSLKTDFKVVAVIPMKNLTSSIKNVERWNIFGIGLGLIASIIAAGLISYSITSPLRKLVRSLANINMNEGSLAPIPRRTDEVGLLWSSIYKMVERIQLLVKEIIHAKVLKQNAEIKALQNQINPHFLNNSLETLRYLVRRGDYRETEEGLVALGDLLKYHASDKLSMSPLRTELDFLKNYLYMQQLRFGDKLCVYYHMDSNLEEIYLPPLLLQPLVENSILHGQSEDHTIAITIRIKDEDPMVAISVIDEGIGMNPEQLNHIWNMMISKDHANHNIGLSNVYQRLKVIYSEMAEMFIRSEPGLGTIVTLKIPKSGWRYHHEFIDRG